MATSSSLTIFTTIWPGGHRLDDDGADRLLADLLREAAHHFEGDVGFEQRAPHLAEGRGDVGFRERTPTGEPREDTGQAVGQAFEHRLALRTYWNRPADETRRTCSAASKALIADANLSRQSGLQNPTTDPL